MLLGLLCLRGGLPAGCFVFVLGLVGFSTPGWGCSLEMGSEVCVCRSIQVDRSTNPKFYKFVLYSCLVGF